MDRSTPYDLLQQQVDRATKGDGSLDVPALLELVSTTYRQHEAHQALDRAEVLMQAAGRAEAEDRFQTILANCPDAVIGLDGAGGISVFNPAAEQLFGRTADEVLGSSVKALFNTWSDRHERILDRLLKGPIPPSLPLIARRWDGGDFPAAVSFCAADIDGAGGLLSFWRDMSDHEAARLTLIEALEQAAAASRTKSEFLAAMSHEIRTPLNGVLGMAGALAKTELTDPQRRMIEVINDSGEALTTLMADILDLSKIEAGLLHLESAPFDLGSSVQAVAQLYERSALDKGLNWGVQIAPEIKGTYLGDDARFRQILQNLVSNAVKFTQTGEVAITAEPLQIGGGVRITVNDTGVGISPMARAKLFARFIQADAFSARKFDGAGLGLSICLDLTRAMGGEMSIDSRPGAGSRFWVDLPLPRAKGEATALDPPHDLRSSHRFSVLAADDNPNNRLVLDAILSQTGADLMFAVNGLEAMTAANERPFDLILMDVQMPVMDGLEAARAIRAGVGPCRFVPIIALTADAMPHQVRACREAGMDAHVAKPIRPDSLLTVIEQALRRGEARPLIAREA